MKCILLLSVVITTYCSAQQVKGQGLMRDSIIQTVSKIDKGISPEMLKNCVVLQTNNICVVMMKEKIYTLKTNKELLLFFSSNKNEISRTNFFVIFDSATSQEKLVDVIDDLNRAKIKNYALVTSQQYLQNGALWSKPTQPVVSLDTSKTKKQYNILDSTYFSITIQKTGIKVRLFEQDSFLKNSDELDSFITKYQIDISTKKIVVIGSNLLPYERVGPVLDVLTKHSYYKYSLIVSD